MSDHKMIRNGICQRCGFDPKRDEPADCIARVVYIPSRRAVHDYIAPNGVTFYGRKTLAEIQFEEATDAVIVTADEGYRLMNEAFRTPVSLITAERFDEMLNILPPCRWSSVGRFEHFHVSERITGNIVSWFIRFRGDAGERFFTFDDYATLTQVELMERVLEFTKARLAATKAELGAAE